MTNAFEQALLKTREFAAHEPCQRNRVKIGQVRLFAYNPVSL